MAVTDATVWPNWLSDAATWTVTTSVPNGTITGAAALMICPTQLAAVSAAAAVLIGSPKAKPVPTVAASKMWDLSRFMMTSSK